MVAANSRGTGQLQDTSANSLEKGDFVGNMATYDPKDGALGSSKGMAPGLHEFEALNMPWLPSPHVKARRVKGSPVHFECRLTQKLHVPGHSLDASAWGLV